jgi:hypothetical protein
MAKPVCTGQYAQRPFISKYAICAFILRCHGRKRAKFSMRIAARPRTAQPLRTCPLSLSNFSMRERRSGVAPVSSSLAQYTSMSIMP